MKSIDKMIKKEFLKSGMSYTDLANKTNFHYNSVRRLFSGGVNTITGGLMLEVLNALGLEFKIDKTESKLKSEIEASEAKLEMVKNQLDSIQQLIGE